MKSRHKIDATLTDLNTGYAISKVSYTLILDTKKDLAKQVEKAGKIIIKKSIQP